MTLLVISLVSDRLVVVASRHALIVIGDSVDVGSRAVVKGHYESIN